MKVPSTQPEPVAKKQPPPEMLTLPSWTNHALSSVVCLSTSSIVISLGRPAAAAFTTAWVAAVGGAAAW